MTAPDESSNLISAFGIGADDETMVAVPSNVPRHDASDGAVAVIDAVALANTSAGPDDGCASPVVVTWMAGGAVRAPAIRAGPAGHHATVCSGTHICGDPPATEISPPMRAVVVLSASDTLKRGDNPLVETLRDERSTERLAPEIETLFQPGRIDPDAVRIVSVAVEYVLAAGDVSLKVRHSLTESALEHARRGTMTGAENSATDGGVVHVEPPVTASIVEIWPLSVFVQMQFMFWESMVAV